MGFSVKKAMRHPVPSQADLLLQGRASSFVDFRSVRLGHLVGNPAEVKNCLTVDA
jgi:hypothetical protein